MSTESFSDRADSPWRSMLFGGLRFSVVGMAGYSVWAFDLAKAGGETGLYLASAVVFIVLGGLALFPEVRHRMSFPRFCLLFAGAFLAFAAVWCAVYLPLRGKHGEVFGFLFGVAALCLVFHFALGRQGSLLEKIGVAFTLHIGGYLAGDLLYYGWLLHENQIAFGRIAWGFFHGLGFGTGLAWVLWKSRSQSDSQR